MKILLTGGAGYIGSHTAVELLNNNYEVIIVDNFYNSNMKAIESIRKITGRNVAFYEGDVCDREVLRRIFRENEIAAVIHFAGYKAVGESVLKPLMYYKNNLDSTIALLEVMNEFGVKNLVFSSSATVYKESKTLPIDESAELGTTNPYGATKLMIEDILRDLHYSDNEWSIALLRYFNPIGAHKSGLIGEDPKGIPNNLMPFIVKVATGELEQLSVFGNDYNTPDGTGVRDYIHVVDLAYGHVCAIDYVIKTREIDAYNLGTGIGYSVLDIVKAFESANNMAINYKIVDRRPGDIAAVYSNPRYAKEKLNWEANKSLEDMCKDAYHFVSKQ